jgi:hypothetical protein
MAIDAGLHQTRTVVDLAGRDRYVFAERAHG